MNTDILILFSLAILLITIGCTDSSSQNPSAEGSSEEEWTILFDGTNTDHWRGYNMDRFPDEAWSIEDEELVFRPLDSGSSQGFDIITTEKYRDFELELEWWISEGGNSGIFHHAIEQPNHQIYWSGIEVQILDNETNANVNDNQLSGSLYDLKPANPQNTKPQGEWNLIRIISEGPHVEYWQNGEKIVEYERWSKEWFDMVRDTKFECHPSFGTIPNGHIGLQDHSDMVKFRNIKVRKL